MIAPSHVKPRPDARDASGLYDELIVDNFAGGGGASMGIEDALGRCVDVAINHDREAVAMHAINHPHTRHLCEDVWAVDPVEATGGRPVGLAWFSPDCKHFSKAKGGKPVSKKIRGLAWVVIRWAKAVRPRIIMLENVEEFSTWGPLGKDNKPCPARKGQTFKRWKGMLVRLGYVVECRELRACDYGAPTIRKRLVIIARCDGLPIVWPEPTHARPDKAKALGLLPWRTAAECIDFSLPCPSIFERRRPLAENTLRRIANGIRRYVIDNPRPFIVQISHSKTTGRGKAHWPSDVPLRTITAANENAVVESHLTTCNHGGPEGSHRGQSLTEPMKTLTASRDAQSVERPVGTITAKGDTAIATAHLTKYHGSHSANETRGQEADEPLLTQDTQNRFGVVAAGLVGAGGSAYAGKPRSVEQPINVIKGDNHQALVATFLAKHFGGVTGVEVDKPAPTVTAVDHNSLVAANLTRIGQTGGNGGYVNPADAPLTTITSKGEHCLTAASLEVMKGTGHGQPVDVPLPTVQAQGQHYAEVRAFLIKYYGNERDGVACTDPMHTVTSKDRVGLVNVRGVEYAISDIGLRMLEPVELYKAQGFPVIRRGRRRGQLAYVIAPVVNGKRLSKAAQVRMVGNSVSPPLATALVRANCADMIAAEAAE